MAHDEKFRRLLIKYRKIDHEKLRELAEKHPDWYLREFAAEFGICFQAIDKRFKTLGITYKKNFYLFRKNVKST